MSTFLYRCWQSRGRHRHLAGSIVVVLVLFSGLCTGDEALISISSEEGLKDMAKNLNGGAIHTLGYRAIGGGLVGILQGRSYLSQVVNTATNTIAIVGEGSVRDHCWSKADDSELPVAL